MNAGPFSSLIAQFNANWSSYAPELEIEISDGDLTLEPSHPLYGEFAALCSGQAGSLPFFTRREAVWCSLGPNQDALRAAVADLQAWILPSFGGEGEGDGFVQPGAPRTGLVTAILAVSPDGYYRWRCRRENCQRVLEKLALKRRLEALRPERARPPRPSLYELRARFAAALLVGDRTGAEDAIELLDSLQLDTALNTQFMRIRLWHHFREHERIREHPQLESLLAQPLPAKVRAWIHGALGIEITPETVPPAPTPPLAEPAIESVPELTSEEVPQLPLEPTWTDWFHAVRRGEKSWAEAFLSEREITSPDDLSPSTISALTEGVETLYVEDSLRLRERALILEGVSELLEEFVREPRFPRANLGDFYLALLRLWCALHAGTSVSQEHGHVLLELASAALELNRSPNEVCALLERWWSARPAKRQLPFALDAIELLERELPDTEASANLWFAAADVISRAADDLPSSDKAIWRKAGLRLGIDAPTIEQYLPADSSTEESTDFLADAGLHHVAIICMREAQAREAAEVIRARTGAMVTMITGKAAGADTDHARQADVVLFVWMAASHAVFRAFDGYDRTRLCYVQGTGASSIVRSLERWAVFTGMNLASN